MKNQLPAELLKDMQDMPFEFSAGRAFYLWVVNILYNYSYKKGDFATRIPTAIVFSKSNMKMFFSFTQKVVEEDYAYLLKNGYEEIEKTISMLSEKAQSAQTFEDFFDRIENLHHTAIFLRKVDKAIISLVNKKYPQEASDILSECNSFERYGYFVQEELALCDQSIEEVYEQFRHITLGYFNEQPRSKEYYANKKEEIQKEGEDVYKKRIVEAHSKRLQDKEKFIVKYPNDKQLFELIGASGWLKEHYKFLVNKAQAVFEPKWVELSNKTGISVESLKNLLHEDLFKLIKGETLNESQLNYYKNTMVFLGKTGAYKFHLLNEDVIEFIDTYLEKKELAPKNEFKGRIACKGFGKGRVVVVLSPQDFHKVQKGDVLVVQNTSPDFVPVLHNVSAVIAEEGGITAHVSVVTRELKIPAVVGVSRVTSLLKDGDMVEVDANTGVVRKIS